ncbi:MAG: hypothetical protein AAF196_01795 [Planctomycetota bacterium]
MIATALALSLLGPLTPADPVAPFGNATVPPGRSATRISVAAEPRVGAADFGLRVEGAQPGSAAFLLFGTGANRFDFAGLGFEVDLGGDIFVALGPTIVAPDGSATLPIALEPNPGLEGLTFYTQWLTGDPLGPLGLAASPGLRFTIRGSEKIVVGAGDEGLEVVDESGAATFTPITVPPSSETNQIDISSDGRTLLSERISLINPRSFAIVPFDNGVVGTPTELLNSAGLGDVELHPLQDVAVALGATPSGNGLVIYDTDPSSVNFAQPIGSIPGGGLIPIDLKLSPNGRRAAHGDLFGGVLVYDLAVATPGLGSFLGPLTIFPSGGLFEWSVNGNALFQIDFVTSDLQEVAVPSSTLLRSAPITGLPAQLRLSPSGQRLAVTYSDRPEIDVFERSGNMLVPTTLTLAAPADNVRWTANDAELILEKPNGFEIIDAVTGAVLRTETWTALVSPNSRDIVVR